MSHIPTAQQDSHQLSPVQRDKAGVLTLAISGVPYAEEYLLSVPYRTVPYRTVPYRTVPYTSQPASSLPADTLLLDRLPNNPHPPSSVGAYFPPPHPHPCAPASLHERRHHHPQEILQAPEQRHRFD